MGHHNIAWYLCDLMSLWKNFLGLALGPVWLSRSVKLDFREVTLFSNICCLWLYFKCRYTTIVIYDEDDVVLNLCCTLVVQVDTFDSVLDDTGWRAGEWS